MSAEQLHLFDPDEYGPGTPPRAARQAPEYPVEPLAPGYTYVRDRRGMIPFAHLIGSTSTNGAVKTLCGKVGTKVPNIGVDTMVRCPECDLEQQLQ